MKKIFKIKSECVVVANTQKEAVERFNKVFQYGSTIVQIEQVKEKKTIPRGWVGLEPHFGEKRCIDYIR